MAAANVRRRTKTLFERQPCADYRSGRGADDKICNPKIDSPTSENHPSNQVPKLDRQGRRQFPLG
jgi:hypothetical protein